MTRLPTKTLERWLRILIDAGAVEDALYDERTDHGRHAREAFAAFMEQEKSDA